MIGLTGGQELGQDQGLGIEKEVGKEIERDKEIGTDPIGEAPEGIAVCTTLESTLTEDVHLMVTVPGGHELLYQELNQSINAQIWSL